MEKNNEIVTRDQAVERVCENMETLRSAYGDINVNKKFFSRCAAVSAISTCVGAVLVATVGFVLVPVAVTGLGVVATAVNGAFYLGENKREKEIMTLVEKNQTAALKIDKKSAKNDETLNNKVKVKEQPSMAEQAVKARSK